MKMKTRSHKEDKGIYEVNIEFDEAHEAWMKNKQQLSNCTYKYICGEITKKGTRCLNNPNCKLHNKLHNKITN